MFPYLCVYLYTAKGISIFLFVVTACKVLVAVQIISTSCQYIYAQMLTSNLYVHSIYLQRYRACLIRSHNLFCPFPNKSMKIKTQEMPAGSQRSKADRSSCESEFLCRSFVRGSSRHFNSVVEEDCLFSLQGIPCRLHSNQVNFQQHMHFGLKDLLLLFVFFFLAIQS